MVGMTCCKNEKIPQVLDLLEQYRQGLRKLLDAFNAKRYATCDRWMKNLEVLMQQLTSDEFQSYLPQNESALQAEQLRIQELQTEFYDRSRQQLNDLLKQVPKRTQLNRLEKFL